MRTREEGRIQSPRRAVVPPSSFLRRRALLTKLFRDRGEKKEIGRTGERGGIRDSGEKIGRIKDREYPWKALGRRAANLPRRARRHRPPAASSSKGTPACVARVVVAAVDGEIGGRSGAPAEKEEEEEKKDVVLFVVHGQYPLVLTSERERRTVCRGGRFFLSFFLSFFRGYVEVFFAGSRARGRIVDETGKHQDGAEKHALRSPLIDFRKGDAARVPHFAFSSREFSAAPFVRRRVAAFRVADPAIDSRALLPPVAPACTYSLTLSSSLPRFLSFSISLSLYFSIILDQHP